MTEASAVEIARRVAYERRMTLDPADIRDSLPQACKMLARLGISAPWGKHLEHDYSLAISGTVASFASETDLLADSIKSCNHITHPSVVKPSTAVPLPFRIQDDVADLDFAGAGTQSLFAFAAVSNVAVEFRYSSALTGNLTVRAIRTPKVNGSTFVIDNLPVVLEDVFIETVIQMASKGMAANG